MAPFKDSLLNFENCLSLLRVSLQKDLSDPTILAGIVKHFELTFETCWKLLKSHLATNLGIQTLSPKDAFKSAYSAKVLDSEDLWLQMIGDRNLSVHVYSEEDARALVARINKDYLQCFESVWKNLKN